MKEPVLTLDEAVSKHRAMWGWIADQTLRLQRKVALSEYFNHFNITERPICKLYCCHYAKTHQRTFHEKYHCDLCPIIWGGNTPILHCQGTIWSKYLSSTDWEECARLAEEIANLPARAHFEGEL